MFELATPWALLLLVLPPIFWFLLPRAKTKLAAALKVPFFTAIASFNEQERYSLAAQATLLIPALIWIALVFALAGPRWIGPPRPIEREGYNIMMALDLSGSMEIPDMALRGHPASRLAVVKNAAEQFVKNRAGDKIGLILFGSRAYLQTPLTYDRHTIFLRLEDATVGLAGKTTSIGDALGLAVKHLKNAPPKGQIIILLTDGANNSGVLDPLKAAQLAKDENIKIYTIGLGSAADPNIITNDFLMQNAAADLDEETLEKIAQLTNGRYFRATDAETLNNIYKTINQLETVSQEQATIRPQIEYYPWFVALAILLSCYWLVRKTGLRFRISSLSSNGGSIKS